MNTFRLSAMAAVAAFFLGAADATKSIDVTTTAMTAEQSTFHDKLKKGDYRKIGTHLGQVVELVNNDAAALQSADLKEYITFNDKNEVMVEIIFHQNTDGSSTIGKIEQLGFKNLICNLNKCTGYAPPSNLVTISQQNFVNFLKPVPRPVKNVGSVTSEGHKAMKTDEVRANFGFQGNGQTIGLISDSFDCLGGYERDIETLDLPNDVQTLDESNNCVADGTDEGRAMAQIIHDVAPLAKMKFHAAFNAGISGLAAAVTNLGDAGCSVITDDVGFTTQAFFQDDEVAQAVDANAARGIPHFGSAGNSARDSWSTNGGFVDSGTTFMGGRVHDFSGNGDVFQSLDVVGSSRLYRLTLQWDEPFASIPNSAGSASDLDIYVSINGVIRAAGQDRNIGQDALEFITFNSGFNTIFIRIVLVSGPEPTNMKWILDGPIREIEFDTQSPTCVAHHNAENGAGVGAADYLETPEFNGGQPATQESFSSAGGVPILFDTLGNRFPAPIVRNQPRFVGPDNGITTFFGDSNNRFSGTSAAAPHVAALAALMLEKNSGLSPAVVYSTLESTAGDMDDTAIEGPDVGFDFGTGFGFVNGLAAVEATPLMTTIAPSTVAPTPVPTTVAPITPIPTAAITPGPTTTIPTTPFPSIPPTSTATSATVAPKTLDYRYNVVNTFSFPEDLTRGPTDEENRGLQRLTEIFYVRVIAASNGQSYDNVNVQVKGALPSAASLRSIVVNFEIIVSFGFNAKLPSAAVVESNIEAARRDVYVQQFVHSGEPENSLYHESDGVTISATYVP